MGEGVGETDNTPSEWRPLSHVDVVFSLRLR